MTLFLISSILLDLDQLQTFTIFLIELLEVLISLRHLELCHLIYPRMWCDMLVFFTNSNLMEFRLFGIILSILNNRLIQLVLDGNSLQEFLVNATVPQCSNYGPTLFLLYINDLLDDVMCDSAIYADDTTHYSKCGQASDL